MSGATSFIHLTDFHVSHPDLRDPGLLSDTAATLERVIGMVNAIEPRPAFVIASGDLTNRGEVASYGLVRSLLDKLEMPVVLALGNHDNRAGFYRGMLDREHGLDAPHVHDAVLAGIHVIVLDSSVPGKIGGALSQDQFAFLDQALERHPEHPKLIVVHHPPALDEHTEIGWESIDFADSERLAAMLMGRNVVGILSGHIHVDRVAHWHGIPVVTAMGLHNAVDPLHGGGLRLVEGTGFAICSLRKSGLSVSFVPLPSSRREYLTHSWERLRSFERTD